MKKTVAFFACLLFIASGFAQDAEVTIEAPQKNVWSLEDCILYGMEHSLEVQQKLIDVYYNELQLKQSKLDRTGTLSGSIDGGRSIGRTLNNINTYVNQSAWMASSGINYGVSVFNAFRLDNIQKMREKSLSATELDLQSIKEDIALQVTLAYLDATSAKELVKIANAQIAASQNELDRTRIKYEAGEAGKDQLLEGQAQLAREESNLADAETSVTYNLLLLSQLLNMDSNENFDIIVPVTEDLKAEINLLSAREIFNTSVDNRPNLKAAEYRIQMEVDNLKATKANLYPNLSFGANYNTDFNNQNRNFITGVKIPFSEQIDNNRRAYVGLRLNIPIFDGFSARNNVKMQELAIENKSIELDIAKRKYRETIQKAYNEALASHKKFLAAKKVAEASKSSYEFAKEKFTYGAMSVFDFNTSKNNLTQAEVQLLQAKYNFIFATKVLDFYRGIEFSL